MKTKITLGVLILGLLGFTQSVDARLKPIEEIKKETELQVKKLTTPILDKFCHDQCKILKVDPLVDVSIPEEVAPGFDDMIQTDTYEYAASSATVTLLIDEYVGTRFRGKILNLLKEHYTSLEYPVEIDVRTSEFPLPVQSARKVGELREKVEATFENSINRLLNQFCPEQCLLGEYEVAVEPVNSEELQYAKSGEFYQEGDTAVRVKSIQATLLLDETLSNEEKNNILEMARMKSGNYRNVDIKGQNMAFPAPGTDGYLRFKNGKFGKYGKGSLYSSESETKNKNDSTTTNSNSSNKSVNNLEDKKSRFETSNEFNKNETANRQERFERYEKIERVEDGDAVQKELKKFGLIALIFGCALLSLLVFLVASNYRSKKNSTSSSEITHKNIDESKINGSNINPGSRLALKRYEIESIKNELVAIFAENPKVAKQVFTRVLTEEGVEITSGYITIFGESIVMDLLRDPSLQSDLNELTEYYAKNPMELTDDEQLELLKALHNRTVAGKLAVFANRSAGLFEFLADMDAIQIFDMILSESLTVKAIVLTQIDSQKRSKLFTYFEENQKLELLSELSRIDHLPKDYIQNVANALDRKRKDNPKLNTEALPGSGVLVNLLEKVGIDEQRTVIRNLSSTSIDNSRTVLSKLVSVDTLPYLRDNNLLEVILSLKHDELLVFLKGTKASIRNTVLQKCPESLTLDLREELESIHQINKESYSGIERKIINRIKVLANEGTLNLLEINERIFNSNNTQNVTEIKASEQSEENQVNKVAGW